MKSFINSFGYAFKGITLAFKQRNFIIQFIIALITVVLAFYFKISIPEWCIILFCIALVLSLEIMNTAIEHFVDLVSPEINQKAGKIKDLAAAAVLIASIISAVIGVIIFLPYLFS